MGCEAGGIHDLQARDFLGYSQGFPLVEELGKSRASGKLENALRVAHQKS